ncbi:MAG: nuclear transport factor 2 family protein [Cytophagia bacterium]|nr:nuclear transport factor 2 family protein [Cytophagia bacterium]NBW36448.1 nuclear transport factor 2 family protein [Cytophagia bacterium]
MSNLQKVKDLHQNYVNAGKLLEGFDQYYADSVVMQELGEEPRIGKEVNRIHETHFLQSIKEVHGAAVVSFAEDSETYKTMVESWIDLTFTNGFRMNMQQVAVQTWENGLIIHEIFYHK